jgi:dephospho-CoA kinase
MVILGLTGSIAMGKSATAAMFRRLGVPVHDSDAEVHKLMAAKGAAVPAVEDAFPGVVVDGKVDRPALGARVFGKPDELKKLEGILHPLVAASRRTFLRRQMLRGIRVVVYDIPLLYEVGADDLCDAVCVVSAPAYLQRLRVLRRPGMSEERLESILARQMPDAQKRRRADFVIPTGLGRAETLRHVRRIVALANLLSGRKWPPR